MGLAGASVSVGTGDAVAVGGAAVGLGGIDVSVVGTAVGSGGSGVEVGGMGAWMVGGPRAASADNNDSRVQSTVLTTFASAQLTVWK